MRKLKLSTKILIGILSVFILVIASIGFIFRKDIQSVMTIKKIDDFGFYTMEYKGDYGLDKFLASGAKTDEELIEFVSKQLLKGLPVTIEVPDLGCSIFTADTPDGDRIFGRNFDLDRAPFMLVKTTPDNGYKSMSLVSLSFLGFTQPNDMNDMMNKVLSLAAPFIPMDGINEKGLSIGVLLLDDAPTKQETGKIPFTTSTAIRTVLDKAATVDEAIEIFNTYDMHDSANANFHYQIADANGNSVIVEYVDNQMNLIYPEDSYQTVTNFYKAPGEKFNIGDGHDRHQRMVDRLTATKGILTPQEGMKLLESVMMVGEKDEGSDIVYDTLWSAVYNNTQKTVDIAVYHDYTSIYHFDLNEVFGK
ncbi:linear amide C-N hydrolase [Erysipelothrix sp. HDW6C]|uniref:linear amide C-N hydrolase n=1 Tax=Erysipelothrix sp. HDW6C TaxID=2714930 RepID=UPI00140B305D|nr:C45 family peptidase [Erysipelothrix sp. HDW6C]QIK69183.1 linear amide C-N hydrolase [Erysipelothrix sp. HDW6C]